MPRDAKRKNKKMQKGKIWPSVLLFLLSLFVGIIIISLVSGFYVVYVINSKLEQCSTTAQNYANAVVYHLEEGMEYQQILDRFDPIDADPKSMCIYVGDELVASYGEMTFDRNQKSVDYETGQEQTIYLEKFVNDSIYQDSQEVSILSMGEDESELYLEEIMSLIWKRAGDLIHQRDTGESGNVVYQMIFWKAKMLRTENEILLIKCNIELVNNDLYGAMLIGVPIMILFLFLFTLQFINVLGALGSQRKIVRAMTTDTVTGGDNWLAFLNKASRILSARRNRQTTYALVDLSLLKYQSYCSLYGVEEGDELLTQMNRFLTRWKGKTGISARVSSGDFALLLKVEEGEGARARMTEKIDQMMEEMAGGLVHKHGKKGEVVHTDKACRTVGFKAGIFFVAPSFLVNEKTVQRRGHVDVEKFYINAGMAKASLSEGEEAHLAVYNDDMLKQQLWQHKVEDHMQAAMDNEEYQVYVQPKYNPVTEQLVGGEALVRWMSSEDGMIPPGKFVPIFEQTGFVTKLDDYMISHVAKLQAKWLSEGKEIVPISVNVSRAHFAKPDLAEHIRDLVDIYEVPHQFIEIELTESAFFDDKKALLTTVNRLQEYGFEVSMDDFGSGYSSLNSLKDLPLNVLKLDAEFFRGEGFDNRGEIVVSEAISLAKQLNMKIVAEGVEKKEQVDFLAKQECDMIQGYYFAKPMPAEEYEQRLSNKET